MRRSENIEQIIGKVPRTQADFLDVRIEKTIETDLLLTNQNAEEVTSSRFGGIAARIYRNGEWGFASVSRTGPYGIRTAIRNAKEATKSNKGGLEKHFPPLRAQEPIVETIRFDPKIDLSELSLEEKATFLKDTQTNVMVDHPKVRSSLTYSETVGTVRIANSNGTDVTLPVSKVTVTISVFQRHRPQCEIAQILGGQGGFEVVQNPRFQNCLMESASQVERLQRARVSRTGHFCAILDPETAGVLIHEVLGHPCEADLFFGNHSRGKKDLSRTIGSPNITVVDDATIPGLAGSLFFDDEGTPGSSKTLVSKGKLSGLLTDLANGSKPDLYPTGNSRSQDYRFPPIVRMTNTFIAPGNWNTEEMFEDTREYVYLRGPSYGQLDEGSGTFQIVGSEADFVRKGERVRTSGEVTAVGSVKQTLDNIDAVADDLQFAVDKCRKYGQFIDVTVGGPHIRISQLHLS